MHRYSVTLVLSLLLLALAQQQQQQQQQRPHPELYKILGISPNATAADVKRAYRKAALKYHPDKLSSSTTQEEIEQFSSKFHQATTAYDILRDPQLRRLYDSGQLDPFTPFRHGWDMSEDEQMRRRYFSRPFMLYARTRRVKLSIEFKKPLLNDHDGLDIVLNVPIALAERMQATGKMQRSVKFEQRVQCSHCQGKGYALHKQHQNHLHDHRQQCKMCGGKGWALHVYTSADGSYQHMENTTCKVCRGTGFVHAFKCPVCAGTGTVSVQKEQVVEFDPAVAEPPTVVIQRSGHQSADGHYQGSLRIQFVFEDHPNFTVDGTTIHHAHQVSLLATAEGFEHTIKLPTGEAVRIRHRGGYTRAFQRVIPGKGVVNKKYERGDLVVRVVPSFDIPLTPEESARLLKLLGMNDLTAIERLQALLSERMQGERYRLHTNDVIFIDNKQQTDDFNA